MPSDETITFVERCDPPISPGTYTLTVKQKLDSAGVTDKTTKEKTDQFQETYVNTKKVVVQGERFRIDPFDIDSVFPTDLSEGAYSRVLPHIMFSRKTLPWDHSSGVSGAPWLALLVFHANDPIRIPDIQAATVDPKGILPLQPAMIGDLLRDRLRKPPPNSNLKERDSTLKPSTVTYKDAHKPEDPWKLGYGNEIWDPCMVVDVPVPLFRQIAPAQEDLRWLAHCRIVNDPTKKKPSEFSALFANRLPQEDGVSAVYLVSLEGLAPFLRKDSQPMPDIKANGANATHLRLVVLKAWSFSSKTDTNHGLGNLNRNHNHGPLRLPYDDRVDGNNEDNKTVKKALEMGYTAFDHNTRWGDRTISWYRGPFLPFNSEVPLVVAPPPINHDGYAEGHGPISTADQALRYVHDLGMLDVSYAAAWQLGRLMALRDKTFSLALFQWKREIRKTTHAAAEGLAMGLQVFIDLFAGMSVQNAAGQNENRPRHANATWRTLIKSIEPLVQLHMTTEAPNIIEEWLDKLRHLDGVPLDYLVPDERMLPTESLRYFQVDPNWIYSLIEGAYSVARDTSSGLAHDTALGRCVHFPAIKKIANPNQTVSSVAAYPQLSGFLLRSAAVAECPGLRVNVKIAKPSNPEEPSNPIEPLRYERLAPDVLLCLVKGMIEEVTFLEPPESINFGLESDGTNLIKRLRRADGKPADKSVPVSERLPGSRVLNMPGRRVLNIKRLADEIDTSLKSLSPKDQFKNFTPAEFALEMLRS